jgi:hypothetical protein
MRRRSRVRTAPRRGLPGAIAALAMMMLGCGARPPARGAARITDEVRLYRDRALVEHRLVIDVASAGRTIVPLRVAGDVGPAGVVVLERGGLAGSEVRLATGRAAVAAVAAPAAPAAVDLLGEPDGAPVAPGPGAGAGPIARPDDLQDPDAAAAEAEAAADTSPDPSVLTAQDMHALDPAAVMAARPPSALELVVDAPRAGRFVVTLGYATQLVRWTAAYTITTGPAHDRATVRGTVTIANAGGVALQARVRLIDRALGAWPDRRADRLRAALIAPPAGRDLGVVAIAAGEPQGETTIALLAGAPPRALRSVLVYDPIGPALDHPGAAPASDPDLGARTHRTTRITESVELDRDPRVDRALPGGAGKLIERRADGARVELGAARLFDAATSAARTETFAIGTARGLIGHRERRDWAKDDDQHRFSEEFLLTIESVRPRPVEVVIREHLYRGQNWTVAYQSAPAAKEGAQQIALRAAVPANGRAKVLYVVVYTW